MPDKTKDIAGIEFLCDPALKSILPEPFPAGRSIPDWFRNLPRGIGPPPADGSAPAALTVKACMPVTDAFSLGWMLPLPADVIATRDPATGQTLLNWDPACPFALIEAHHPAQVGAPAPPFDTAAPLKWMNPWRIAVPAGYSVLFTHPLNHFELPFQCFSGVVDADRFTPLVNIPFLWTGAGQQDITLAKGTPFAQIIPIERDRMPATGNARAATESEMADLAEATRRKQTEDSVYAREWRARREP